MKLTSEEKKICKKYSKRDADGLVHCKECPLRIPDLINVCKATCTKKEWKDYLQWRGMRKLICHVPAHDTKSGAGALKLITYMLRDDEFKPAIIEERIIYCKDCKHNVANRETDPNDITDYSGTDIVCDYFMTDGLEPYDYCSKAERKEE